MNWIAYIVMQSICWQSSKKPRNVHKEVKHMCTVG